MTKETARDYLPLVQALADGKSLEMKEGGIWMPNPCPDFTMPPACYRIKPEPRRWFLVAFGVTQPLQVWTTRPIDVPSLVECVEVVEVIKP